MSIKPVSTFSQMAHSFMNNAGAKSGFDSIVQYGGIGAGAGAINGAFSDYEGVFSGAMKGAVVGSLGGYGIKHYGSKYASGFEKKVSNFTNAINLDDANHLKDRIGFDPKLLNTKLGEGQSSFLDEFTGGADRLKGFTQGFDDYIERNPNWNNPDHAASKMFKPSQNGFSIFSKPGVNS